LKNSTGEIEIPGSLIHLFAPPDSVTMDAGSICIIIIKNRKNKNRNHPNFGIRMSGLICAKLHIIRIDKTPVKSCLKKK
jgi:hypothetical protein